MSVACRMYVGKFPNRRVPAATSFRIVEIQFKKDTQHNNPEFLTSEDAEIC